MKIADIEILIVPGWKNSGADHWQSRWQANLSTARRVEQNDWENPDLESWSERIVEAVAQAHRPAVIVAHSLGVIAAVHAAERLSAVNVAGAFLVAPADVELSQAWPNGDGTGWPPAGGPQGFDRIPRAKLLFPVEVVAAADDPYCAPDRARDFADAWGASFVDAGARGHINEETGHGPWPEGVLQFGKFLRALG